MVISKEDAKYAMMRMPYEFVMEWRELIWEEKDVQVYRDTVTGHECVIPFTNVGKEEWPTLRERLDDYGVPYQVFLSELES